MSSPFEVLGLAPAGGPYPAIDMSTIQRSSLLEIFKTKSPDFAAQYSFLVNPHVTYMIQSRCDSGDLPEDPASSYLSWKYVAMQRADCGTTVLEFLMDNISGRDVLKTEQSARFPLFLVVVGSIIAATATRELRYVEVSLPYLHKSTNRTSF